MIDSFTKSRPLDLIVRVGAVVFINGVLLTATLDMVPGQSTPAPAVQPAQDQSTAPLATKM